MSQNGKAGRDLIQVGRDFIKKIIINIQILVNSNPKSSASIVLFAISIVAIAIDIFFKKNLSLCSLILGAKANSLDAIILIPISLFIIGFIPILGGIGVFGSLLTLLSSLQQLSFFPGSLGLLTGVMSGISFRKSLIG